MGAKSTVDISREGAISFITECLNDISDEALAEVVESLNDDLLARSQFEKAFGLSNFRIGDPPRLPLQKTGNYDF